MIAGFSGYARPAALLLIIMISLTLPAGALGAELNLPSFRHPYDYMLHYGINCAVFCGTGYLMEKKAGQPKWAAAAAAFAGTTALWVWKEYFYDNAPERGDIAANILGQLTGFAVVINLKW